MYDMTSIPVKMKAPRSTGVRTRPSYKKLFKIRRPRTEKFKKSFSYACPKKWNKLSEHIQLSQSKTEFKSKIKSYVEQKSAVCEHVQEWECFQDIT